MAQRPRGHSSRIEALELPVAGAVQRETREALIRALGGLEEEQRLPIVLHFLEGLTQAQIGALAGVAQSVVARRIAVGLASLRSRLSRSGVGASALALPGLLRTEGLLQATPALRRALASSSEFASPFQALPPAGRMPRSIPAASSSPFIRIGLATSALAAAVLTLVALEPAPPQARATFSPARATVVATAPARPAAQTGIHRTWDFRFDPPNDVTLLTGEWSWVKGQGMETVSPTGVCALLPLEVSELPLRAAITYGFSKSQFRAVADILQTDGVFKPPFTTWLGGIGAKGGLIEAIVYLAPEKDVGFVDNTMIGLREYTTNLPRSRLCLVLDNCIVSRVTLQTIARQGMPVSDKELESYKKGCEKIKFVGAYKF